MLPAPGRTEAQKCHSGSARSPPAECYCGWKTGNIARHAGCCVRFASDRVLGVRRPWFGLSFHADRTGTIRGNRSSRLTSRAGLLGLHRIGRPVPFLPITFQKQAIPPHSRVMPHDDKGRRRQAIRGDPDGSAAGTAPLSDTWQLGGCPLYMRPDIHVWSATAAELRGLASPRNRHNRQVPLTVPDPEITIPKHNREFECSLASPPAEKQ